MIEVILVGSIISVILYLRSLVKDYKEGSIITLYDIFSILIVFTSSYLGIIAYLWGSKMDDIKILNDD